MGGQKFVNENRPVVPNDRPADTSVMVLVTDDPTATRKEDELSEQRRAVSVLVALASPPSVARRRSVLERGRGLHPRLASETACRSAHESA